MKNETSQLIFQVGTHGSRAMLRAGSPHAGPIVRADSPRPERDVRVEGSLGVLLEESYTGPSHECGANEQLPSGDSVGEHSGEVPGANGESSSPLCAALVGTTQDGHSALAAGEGAECHPGLQAPHVDIASSTPQFAEQAVPEK